MKIKVEVTKAELAEMKLDSRTLATLLENTFEFSYEVVCKADVLLTDTAAVFNTNYEG